MTRLIHFLNESNGIEGILQPPTEYQVGVATLFLSLPRITTPDVLNVVKVFQPNARLRDKFGMDVLIGDYSPPTGGPQIRINLDQILECVSANGNHPIHYHKDFENLHPCTDCNGRSGRLVWLWQMMKFDYEIQKTFLHTFYYQALEQL